MTIRVSRTFMLSAIALALLTTGILIPQAVRAAHPDASTHLPHFFKSRYALGSNAKLAASNNLVYNGGPVMAGAMHAYLIFWEPTGSFVSDSYNSLIQRYF